jgi:glycosyltransferase involved in cell wall biosynthesis
MRGVHQRIMIAAVIPALDEEASIASVVRELSGHVDRVIVVDNGSKDGTPSAASGAGALVVLEPKKGYGRACLSGIDRARELEADVILLLDGDGSDDPADAPRVLGPVVAGRAELVLGVRAGEVSLAAMAPIQRFGNRLVPWLARVLFGAEYSDMPPYKALRLSAFDRLGVEDEGFGFTLDLLLRAHAHGLRTVEVPVTCRPRAGGRSKVSGTVLGTVKASSALLYMLLRRKMLTTGSG